ncbi:MAG: hypothetical protein RRZ69_05950 [Clostridia bacterium]
MSLKFGKILLTCNVNDKVEKDSNFAKEIVSAMRKYAQSDWGDLGQSDKKLNELAVKNGDERVLASYKTSLGKVYIITEWDRSATTILFANEY